MADLENRKEYFKMCAGGWLAAIVTSFQVSMEYPLIR